MGAVPPKARDPRMDRPPEAPSPLSVVVLPDATQQTHELSLAARTPRRWVISVVVLLLVSLVLGTALGIAWPRALAYDELVAEHLELQERLRRIDGRMSEIDRLLLRLRLYDAQLESLGEARGDAGPIPEGAAANAALELQSLGTHADGQTGLRPAVAWAAGVEARANTFLSTFEDREPGLSRFVSELEELEALERALPSMWPSNAVLTSGFRWRRNPALGQRWRFHSGIDLGGPRGTPIYAAAQGQVIKAGWSGGYGRHIEIDHGFGIVTLYAHNSRLLVSEGDVVQQGQKIGLMGSTGRSTGPHLHFEVHLDGAAVDPMDYLRRAKRPGRTPRR